MFWRKRADADRPVRDLRNAASRSASGARARACLEKIANLEARQKTIIDYDIRLIFIDDSIGPPLIGEAHFPAGPRTKSSLTVLDKEDFPITSRSPMATSV
jgi:hypothetical protein